MKEHTLKSSDSNEERKSPNATNILQSQPLHIRTPVKNTLLIRD